MSADLAPAPLLRRWWSSASKGRFGDRWEYRVEVEPQVERRSGWRDMDGGMCTVGYRCKLKRVTMASETVKMDGCRWRWQSCKERTMCSRKVKLQDNGLSGTCSKYSWAAARTLLTRRRAKLRGCLHLIRSLFDFCCLHTGERVLVFLPIT